ncbi:hypothetical protein Hs30E_18310 [Lactococcus hodotermopsidis]|uniref:Uncharacterized protein n=1 Tax=Pseudolactococcus hodotermopsidis TaxID=2709157 RepID=A0A6A0BCY5_9LACT|nr:hypothetical protein [Lactococcus hodotermopsidis]GFH43280.1 hypothetical protein Hs30E_18310 [Lactococcus hodotermopsidis]
MINLVKKYFDDDLSNLENPILTEIPQFQNGLSIKQTGSDMEIFLYQKPFSEILVKVIYDENHDELYRDCLVYENDGWTILP